MTQMPPTAGYVTPGAGLKPHRGTMILVLGILGLVVCFICGIIAVALQVVGIAVLLLLFMFGLFAAASGIPVDGSGF